MSRARIVIPGPQVDQPAGVAPLASESIRGGGSALAGKQAAVGIEGLRQDQCPGGVGQLAHRAQGIGQEVLPSARRLLGDAPHPVQVAVRPFKRGVSYMISSHPFKVFSLFL